jgi:hypothetical protein
MSTENVPDTDGEDTTDTGPEGDPDPWDREDMLRSVDAAIEEVERKIENGRVRDPEREKIRVKQYRALGYLLRTKRKIVNDKQLVEMDERVSDLEEARAEGDLFL